MYVKTDTALEIALFHKNSIIKNICFVDETFGKEKL